MREQSDNAAPLESAVARTIRQAKRHPASLDTIEKEVAREMGSQKTPRIVAVIETLVEHGSVIVFPGAAAEYYWKENLTGLKTRLCEVLRAHGTNNPMEAHLKSKDAIKRFSKTKTTKKQRNIDPRLFDMTVAECKRSRLIEETEEGLILAGAQPDGKADDLQRELRRQVLDHVKDRTHQKLDPGKLAGSLGLRVPVAKKLLKDLVSAGSLVYIEDGRYLEPGLVHHARELLGKRLSENDGAHVSELMKLLAIPRRGTIALLEYFDRTGFTKRDGDLRVLNPPKAVSSM